MSESLANIFPDKLITEIPLKSDDLQKLLFIGSISGECPGKICVEIAVKYYVGRGIDPQFSSDPSRLNDGNVYCSRMSD